MQKQFSRCIEPVITLISSSGHSLEVLLGCGRVNDIDTTAVMKARKRLRKNSREEIEKIFF